MKKGSMVKLTIGIIILMMGVGLFLESLEILSFGSLLKTYWPVLLLIIGLVGVLTESNEFGYFIITIFAAFKVVEIFLGKSLNVWDIFVPVLIIMIGLSIIKKNI